MTAPDGSAPVAAGPAHSADYEDGPDAAEGERYVPVGPRYCTVHHGFQEEDAYVCDFWEEGTEECATTPLLVRQSPVLIGSVGQ